MTQDNGTSDVRNSARAQGVESEAGDGLGVALCSPGSPSAADGLRGAQRGAERVSDAEAAEWGRLAGEATEGPWVVDADGSVGAPMVGLVCDEDGHPRLDCSECGTQVCHTSVMPGEPDAAFIAASRTAVPRLLAEREALRAEVERLHGQARFEDVIYLDVCRQLDHERAVRTEIAAERDRARGTAAHLEAENALLSEGVERLSSKIYKLRREAMDDLMALDRVLYAKACELFDNPKDSADTSSVEIATTAALDAVRAALTSDDPAVMRAMAERVGLRVNTRIEYEAVCRGSLDQTGQPRSFSFGSDRANRVLEAILRRKFGLSPETHLVMCAELLTASVTVGGPWREVPDADA